VKFAQLRAARGATRRILTYLTEEQRRTRRKSAIHDGRQTVPCSRASWPSAPRWQTQMTAQWSFDRPARLPCCVHHVRIRTLAELAQNFWAWADPVARARDGRDQHVGRRGAVAEQATEETNGLGQPTEAHRRRRPRPARWPGAGSPPLRWLRAPPEASPAGVVRDEPDGLGNDLRRC